MISVISRWIAREACDAIASSVEDLSEMGVLPVSCRQDMGSEDEFQVTHIRREFNQITHCLAKLAFRFVAPHV